MQDYESKHSGKEIDDILDDVANKVDKVEGKGLSSEDFTFAEKQKLAGLENYDDAGIRNDLATLHNNVVEVREDLDQVTTLANDLNTDIGDLSQTKQDVISDLDAIRGGAGKGNTSVQGVYVNNKMLTPDGRGNISLPNIPSEADIAKMGFTKNKGTVTGVVVNGESKSPNSAGVVDLGKIKVDEVKFANDLTGVVEATPEMFTYRPSAGDKSVRDESAVIRRIKGNTSVWGQLAFSNNYSSGGLQFKYNNNGTVELNGTTTSAVHIGKVANINGHKYLSVCEVLSMGNMEKFSFGNLNNYYERSSFTSVGAKYLFANGPASTNNYIGITDFSIGTAISNVILRYQRFDLTDIFGAGNEPTTYEEFRQYYPDDYYPYCAPEIRSMRATGIETIGFNAFNGAYAEVIGGQAYYLGVTIDTAHFATEIGGEMTEITIPENGLYTPPTNGYIYATGRDICINLSHSGVRNGEYEEYEKNTLLLPEIAKYFPEGMHGIGDVYDEINEEMAIQRIGEVDLGVSDIKYNSTRGTFYLRLYNSKTLGKGVCPKFTLNNVSAANLSNGEMSFHSTYYDNSVIFKATSYTDVPSFKLAMEGVKLYYELSAPIYTPIDDLLQLDYKVDDFGTEKILSNAPSAPFKADIIYQFNAEGRIRDNSRNIEKLEELAKQPSDWLEDNPSSPAYIKNKPTLPTAIAPVTEVIVEYSLPSTLLPNVIHEVAVGLGAFTMPPLYQGDSRTRNVYKMVFVAPEASKITFNYSVNWRDGVAPNWENSGDVVEMTFTTMAEVTTILGEWKLYKL